jgi:hypothetical protein
MLAGSRLTRSDPLTGEGNRLIANATDNETMP